MTKTNAQSNTRDRDIRNFFEKIVVNTGVGRLAQQPNFADKGLASVKKDLSAITGQEAQVRPAKKSIAGFKLREGQIVGLRVTLRDRRMVDFFERLITIVMPRVHDFRGISLDSVDAGGALNIGFREQLVFPEISAEESQLTFPLGINLVPREKNKEKALETYRKLGVPLMAEGAKAEKRKGKRKTKRQS